MASDDGSCDLQKLLITALTYDRLINALSAVISRAINKSIDSPTVCPKPDDSAYIPGEPETQTEQDYSHEPSQRREHVIKSIHDELPLLCYLEGWVIRCLPPRSTAHYITNHAGHCRHLIGREEVYKPSANTQMNGKSCLLGLRGITQNSMNY